MNDTSTFLGYRTRTGGFPIGFRRMGGAWSDDTDHLIKWMLREKFDLIDLGPKAEVEIDQFQKAGIRIGTVDLHEWSDYPRMLSQNKIARNETIKKATARIRACSALGAKTFFTLMLTAMEELPASNTFDLMLESYGSLVPVLEETGSRISIEGWPEMQAHCCNPESYRAFLREIKSPAFGINYDPSHLIRLGIDPIRFLREFVSRVVHVHGKDTEIFPEKLYELGWEQRSARLGGDIWRYTIPGHGEARWPAIFQILCDAGYTGGVCIEHEDARFLGTPEIEKEGLVLSASFLATC